MRLLRICEVRTHAQETGRARRLRGRTPRLRRVRLRRERRRGCRTARPRDARTRLGRVADGESFPRDGSLEDARASRRRRRDSHGDDGGMRQGVQPADDTGKPPHRGKALLQRLQTREGSRRLPPQRVANHGTTILLVFLFSSSRRKSRASLRIAACTSLARSFSLARPTSRRADRSWARVSVAGSDFTLGDIDGVLRISNFGSNRRAPRLATRRTFAGQIPRCSTRGSLLARRAVRTFSPDCRLPIFVSVDEASARRRDVFNARCARHPRL